MFSFTAVTVLAPHSHANIRGICRLRYIESGYKCQRISVIHIHRKVRSGNNVYGRQIYQIVLYTRIELLPCAREFYLLGSLYPCMFCKHHQASGTLVSSPIGMCAQYCHLEMDLTAFSPLGPKPSTKTRDFVQPSETEAMACHTGPEGQAQEGLDATLCTMKR